MFITASPTSTPSTLPSKSPVTLIPSSFPTITGAVSSVSLSGSVTSDILDSDILDIAMELSQIYGVDENDVETTVNYITSGVLEIIVPDDITETQLINSLQESISDVLGIHLSDVVVTIDEEGVATYSISGATFAEVSGLQEITGQDDFADLVSDELRQIESDISVHSSTSNAEIEVVISATIATTDSSVTTDPESAVAELIQHYGLTDAQITGNMISNL